MKSIKGLLAVAVGIALLGSTQITMAASTAGKSLTFFSVIHGDVSDPFWAIYRKGLVDASKLYNVQIKDLGTQVHHARAKREASDAIAVLGIKINSTEAPVAVLSGGQRQSIAIARAVHFGGRLLVLDEPTSALALRQTSQVLATIEKTREQGAAVLFVSHNVRHAFQVADHFVILSQGDVVADVPKEDADFDQISTLIMEGKAVVR